MPGIVWDGIEGILVIIVGWIVMTLVIVLLYWFLCLLVWPLIIVFIAILYWVFFRALRIVFKKSGICKGNLLKSLAYGLIYTTLYSIWIYSIIFGTHYLVKFHSAV